MYALITLIERLLAGPRPSEGGWLVSVKQNIKALNQLNPAAAVKYRDEFIELAPKESLILK